MKKKSIRPPFTLDIFNKTRRPVPCRPFLKLLHPARIILQREKRIYPRQAYRLELSLVGIKTITSLNAIHHHRNRPTDVIALSYYDKKKHDRPSRSEAKQQAHAKHVLSNNICEANTLVHLNEFVGEIFICLPYALQQAKKIGQSLTEELCFLFIHGLLHCFGYDHKKPKEEAHMQNLTYRILGRM